MQEVIIDGWFKALRVECHWFLFWSTGSGGNFQQEYNNKTVLLRDTIN